VLDYNLVVFSPYRDLVIYLKDSRMKPLADFAWYNPPPPCLCPLRGDCYGIHPLK